MFLRGWGPSASFYLKLDASPVPGFGRCQGIYANTFQRAFIVKRKTKRIVKLLNTWKFQNIEQARKEAT